MLGNLIFCAARTKAGLYTPLNSVLLDRNNEQGLAVFLYGVENVKKTSIHSHLAPIVNVTNSRKRSEKQRNILVVSDSLNTG